MASCFHWDQCCCVRAFIFWRVACDCGGRVMSCLRASRSLSVFVTLSLYHTHRCTNTNLYTHPQTHMHLNIQTHGHTHMLKKQTFLPIVKDFHNRGPSITAGSSNLRHASLYGSYFSLIDFHYYNVMITIEPLDGWLHAFLKLNDFACLAGTVVRKIHSLHCVQRNKLLVTSTF